MLANRSAFSADHQHQTIVVGDIALTSSVASGERYTAEVAVKQSDGSWLWVIDDANFTSPDYAKKHQLPTGP